AFELHKKDGVYRFNGHGSGHGVGLCVIGSAKLAERGVNADAILARYFPGLEISRGLPPVRPGVRRGSGPGSDPGGTDIAPSTRGSNPGGTDIAPSTRGSDSSGTDIAPSTRELGNADASVVISLPDDDEGERATIAR